MSKKQLIEQLNNAPIITATMLGGRAREDWAEWCADLLATYPNGESKDTGFYFNDGSNRFVLVPKLNRIRTGWINIKSSRYCFTWDNICESYGDTKDLKEVDGGLELTMFDGAIIRYTVA